MTRFLLILAVTALLAAGCAAQDGAVTADGGPTDADATAEPTADPTADPADRSTDDTTGSQEGGPPGELTGTFERRDVEGGCAVLEVDGQTYELVAAPQSAVAIDPANGVIATVDGDVIARAGDTVTVTGQVDDGLMTFCQVGPILAVEDATAA